VGNVIIEAFYFDSLIRYRKKYTVVYAEGKQHVCDQM